MRKYKQCVCELSRGELAMEVTMEADLSDEDGNGDFALTVARLALQACQGGRGEHDEAN